MADTVQHKDSMMSATANAAAKIKDGKRHQRKKHKNSRLGCSQCKQRRIKCDETLPSCKKCETRSIRCSYLNLSPSEIQTIHHAHLENDEHVRPGAHSMGQLYPDDELIFYQEPAVHEQPLNPHIQLSNIQRPPVDHQQQQQQQQQQDQQQDQQDHHHQHHQHQHNIAYSYPQLPSSIPGSILNMDQVREEAIQSFSTPPSSTAALTPQTPRSTRHAIQSIVLEHRLSSQPKEKSPGFSINKISPASTYRTSSNSPSFKTNTTVRLIRHPSCKTLTKNFPFKEFYDDTIFAAAGRLFIYQQSNTRFVNSVMSLNVFYSMMLQGVGKLSDLFPDLKPIYYKYRGYCIENTRYNLANITDENAYETVIMSTTLSTTAVHSPNMSVKEFFALASGPSIVIQKGYENPDAFPKSFVKLQSYANSLLHTAKSIWYPLYNHHVLYEFLEVLKSFGTDYINNEDHVNYDDNIRKCFRSLVEFTEFTLNLLVNERSNKHMLRYPVDKLMGLLQKWYLIVPSDIYTFGSSAPPINKVLYLAWFALSQILEQTLAGCRYIFTFLFHGWVLTAIFDEETVSKGLDDPSLRWYSSYFSRIMAFLTRRMNYISRNTVLNEPIPVFFDPQSRFRPRSLNIHERCIINFKDTLIKPYHYPMEASTSTNLNSQNKNYYKIASENRLYANDLTNGIEGLGENKDETLDLLDSNPKTGLLNKDFDPRFTDPIFDAFIQFHTADLEFLKKYIEDRKLVMQLDVS